MCIDSLQGKEMSESWRSDLIPVCKGKGDVSSCGSCKSVKLLEHGIKIIEKII